MPYADTRIVAIAPKLEPTWVENLSPFWIKRSTHRHPNCNKDNASMPDETLLTLAADIVSAHVSNNSIAAGDLPTLIKSVYASLADLGQAPAEVEEKREPAVSVRSSVKSDAIACLECGSKLKLLKRHLNTDHNLTPEEYRSRWSLPASYPLVAPDYAAKRKELALKIGLGRKAAPEPAPAKAKAPRRKKPAAEAAA
jgi:predicted transcriptional regulator